MKTYARLYRVQNNTFSVSKYMEVAPDLLKAIIDP
jgi:hypothetical protein